MVVRIPSGTLLLPLIQHWKNRGIGPKWTSCLKETKNPHKTTDITPQSAVIREMGKVWTAHNHERISRPQPTEGKFKQGLEESKLRRRSWEYAEAKVLKNRICKAGYWKGEGHTENCGTSSHIHWVPADTGRKVQERTGGNSPWIPHRATNGVCIYQMVNTLIHRAARTHPGFAWALGKT